MKTRHTYISFLLVLIALTTSCSKDFLKEDPSTAISVDKAILTDGDMMEALAGTYRILESYFLFGRNSVVMGDILADNVYLSSSNSGRLLTLNNYSFAEGATEARYIWAQSYYAILQANRIIGSDLKESVSSSQLRGEAYALRALLYLNLVNWYGKSYMVNPAADGVPLITVSSDKAGVLIMPARNSVAEVYAQIISDLDKAYAMMPATPPTIHVNNTNFISKPAVKAIQARAYLYKGDYENARDAALIVKAAGYSLAVDAPAFTAYWAATTPRTDKLETIFEISNTAIANNGVEGMDWLYAKGGIGDYSVTDDTYAIYSATDRRRDLILNSTRGTGATAFQAYYVNKYQNVGIADRDEVKLFRYAEVLLTLAESYAKLNDEPTARGYLNMVAQNRDPSLVAYTYTGQALFDAIILERRKELAFEGLRFFDLMRTNASFTRQNMGAKAYSSYPNVLTTDFRRQQPIPEVERMANPGIAKNPGY